MHVREILIRKSRVLAVLAATAAALAPGAAAHAQAYGVSYSQPAPLYPYVAQPRQNVYAPPAQQGAYIIQVPAAPLYPYARTRRLHRKHATTAPVAEAVPKPDRRHKGVDPALVGELRKHGHRHIETKIINTTKIVREKPIVIEKKRYVDDPPIVIERRHVVEDPMPGEQARGKRTARGGNDVRVIHAEAEVTILGPDRMNIRLFRKRGTGTSAKAE